MFGAGASAVKPFDWNDLLSKRVALSEARLIVNEISEFAMTVTCPVGSVNGLHICTEICSAVWLTQGSPVEVVKIAGG